MDIRARAAAFGFADCFVYPTEPFALYERRLHEGDLHPAARKLTIDAASEAPWANAILALISPYQPYAEEIALSGYYPSSNAAYHASGRLMRQMEAEGMRTERVELPVRELLTRGGTGVVLKNGLTYLPGYGTRYSVQTLLARLPEPAYTPVRKPTAVHCAACHACERICPSGAIDREGFHFARCARSYMEGYVMEPWVMEAMRYILGCELCQKACPYNAGIESLREMPEAFRLEELLRGNVKPALEIVGKNLNKQGRVIQHACVVAANRGRADLLPLIEPWLTDKRDGVRAAATYAMQKLRG